MVQVWATSDLENKLRNKGFINIAGMDEVGRGALAGPAIVGCVLLQQPLEIAVCDSKLISAKRREQLYDQLCKSQLTHSLGKVAAEEIDQLGLTAALALAYRRAFRALKKPVDLVIMDGTFNFLAADDVVVHNEVAADRKHSCVAAASIMAKVWRDQLMKEFGHTYPAYGFETNVGYGTAKHRAIIAKHGQTPLHRKSFGV